MLSFFFEKGIFSDVLNSEKKKNDEIKSQRIFYDILNYKMKIINGRYRTKKKKTIKRNIIY